MSYFFAGKKLRKLAKITLTLSRNYGLVYTVRIIFEEIKKQRMELFKSDKTFVFVQKSEIDYDTNYKIWKNKYLFANNDEKIINNMKKLKYIPEISLFLICDEHITSQKTLINSVESILNQLYKNWNLVIVSNGGDWVKTLLNSKTLDILEDKRITLKKSDTFKADFLNKLVSESSGDFLAFFNSGDVLAKDALFQIINILNENHDTDIIYTDEDQIDLQGNKTNPFFKPDWSPYLFLGMNYLQRFCLINRKIFDKSHGFKVEFKENALYDLFLRCSELTKKITHVPIPLCSVVIDDLKHELGHNSINRILTDTMVRRKIDATIENGFFPNTFRTKFKLESEPKVSIIIPTKDNENLLRRCIRSIEKNTAYKNWEIIIVDNNSKDEKTKSYLSSLPYKVIKYESQFNFSKINNMAVSKSEGEYLLFLNDDTEALDSDWLREMVSICKQKDVGAVGAKLVFVDDTIQHAGMIILKNGTSFHPFQKTKSNTFGYFGFLNTIKEYSTVTGACLLTKRTIFDKVGMFDEDFDLYYGDSDLCLMIRKLGYTVLYTPYAKLRHDGSSKIREYTASFFAIENFIHFIKKWPSLKNGDPFYNPNLDWDYNLDVN
jgi:O-antigen biosynthesis protein